MSTAKGNRLYLHISTIKMLDQIIYHLLVSFLVYSDRWPVKRYSYLKLRLSNYLN